MNRNLAIGCAVFAAVLVAAYFGACASLVPGDTGGKGEVAALVFGLVFAGAAVFFWRRRGQPMQ